jgi:hypothetical protein
MRTMAIQETEDGPSRRQVDQSAAAESDSRHPRGGRKGQFLADGAQLVIRYRWQADRVALTFGAPTVFV